MALSCGLQGSASCLLPLIKSHLLPVTSPVVLLVCILALQRILTHAGPVLLRARDICDANRDITLGMLWAVAMKWQVPALDWTVIGSTAAVVALLTISQRQVLNPTVGQGAVKIWCIDSMLHAPCCAIDRPGATAG